MALLLFQFRDGVEEVYINPDLVTQLQSEANEEGQYTRIVLQSHFDGTSESVIIKGALHRVAEFIARYQGWVGEDSCTRTYELSEEEKYKPGPDLEGSEFAPDGP